MRADGRVAYGPSEDQPKAGCALGVRDKQFGERACGRVRCVVGVVTVGVGAGGVEEVF